MLVETDHFKFSIVYPQITIRQAGNEKVICDKESEFKIILKMILDIYKITAQEVFMQICDDLYASDKETLNVLKVCLELGADFSWAEYYGPSWVVKRDKLECTKYFNSLGVDPRIILKRVTSFGGFHKTETVEYLKKVIAN